MIVTLFLLGRELLRLETISVELELVEDENEDEEGADPGDGQYL